MSDPLSIAASLAGIASTGFFIAKGLYQIADGIGSAGQEVRIYADEVGSFSKLLLKVRSELQQPSHGSHDDDVSLVRDILEICEKALAPLDRLQHTLKPLLVKFRQSSRKLRQFGLRVQWIFTSKAKLLFYRDLLRSQHRMLDTTLELMILKATRDKSPHNIYIMQMSLEHSMAGLNFSLQNSAPRLHLDNSQQTKPFPATLAFNTENKVAAEDTRDECIKKRESAEDLQESISAADIDMKGSGEITQTALVLSTLPSDHAMEGYNDEDLRDLDASVDRDLMPTSNETFQDLWDDMRSTSRKVMRLATGVLNSIQEDAKTEVPTAQSAKLDAPTPVPGTETQSSTPVKNTTGAASVSAPVQDQVMHFEEIIYFVDPDGETYDLPFLEVRDWKAMLNTIAEILGLRMNADGTYYCENDTTSKLVPFRNTTRRLQAINKGAFTLHGPSNQILLPRMWSRILRPQWKVVFKFTEKEMVYRR